MKTIKSEPILYLCYNISCMPNNIWIFNSWQIIQKKTTKKTICCSLMKKMCSWMMAQWLSTKSRKVTLQDGLPRCHQWSMGSVSLAWMRGESENMQLIVKHPFDSKFKRSKPPRWVDRQCRAHLCRASHDIPTVGSIWAKN